MARNSSFVADYVMIYLFTHDNNIQNHALLTALLPEYWRFLDTFLVWRLIPNLGSLVKQRSLLNIYFAAHNTVNVHLRSDWTVLSCQLIDYIELVWVFFIPSIWHISWNTTHSKLLLCSLCIFVGTPYNWFNLLVPLLPYSTLLLIFDRQPNRIID